MVVQGVGLRCHRLDSNAFPGGRRVDLDSVVLFLPGLLPDVQSAGLALEENVSLGLICCDCKFFAEAKTIVDEFVADGAAPYKASVVLEISGGQFTFSPKL